MFVRAQVDICAFGICANGEHAMVIARVFFDRAEKLLGFVKIYIFIENRLAVSNLRFSSIVLGSFYSVISRFGCVL